MKRRMTMPKNKKQEGASRKEDKMAKEMLKIVNDNWERLAKQYGISRGQIEDMRPAFSICVNSDK